MSRTQNMRNSTIRIEVEVSMVNDVRMIQLKSHGHIQGMDDNKFPKIAVNWCLRLRGEESRISSVNGVKETMKY